MTTKLRLGAVVLTLYCFALSVRGEPAYPTAVLATQDSGSVAAAPFEKQLDDAKVELSETIRARNKAASEADARLEAPLLANRERLLAWLVDLLSKKVKTLEELLAIEHTSPLAIDDDPLVKSLAGIPPHSALKVDALRDEFDGVKETLAATEASLRANQIQMQNLRDQLEARGAAVRRARDPALVPLAGPKDTNSDREVAELSQRAAATELEVVSLSQEILKHKLSALRTREQGLEAVVVRVLPSQRLTPDDVAVEQQRARAERIALVTESAVVTRRNARRRAELDKHGGATTTRGPAADQRSAALEQAIKTDNAILKGLGDLQMLAEASGDAWEQRYVVLSTTDPEQRRAALNGLREFRQKLGDARSMYVTRRLALEIEIREERMRLGTLDGAEPSGQSDRLANLLQQVAMDERVELRATRLERQVSRWLGDFADSGDRGFEARIGQIAERVGELLRGVWQQELFVAEDVSEVDGHRVNVQYGVTVGKSIGMVAVLALGFWLCSRSVHFLQRTLVRRFAVEPHVASMVRRWSMIVLCAALVLLVLNLARIPLSMFAFLGGALAIGVGFGAQTVIKNFISGLIMLIERKVRVGDTVELGGIVGRVTAVDLRATTVRSANGIEALIPNANFVENQVINWTYSNRKVRHELAVGIAYGADLRVAALTLLTAATEHPFVLDDPAPEVFLDSFGDSALQMVLLFWVETGAAVAPRRVESDLRYVLYERLPKAGIEIPCASQELCVSFDRLKRGIWGREHEFAVTSAGAKFHLMELEQRQGCVSSPKQFSVEIGRSFGRNLQVVLVGVLPRMRTVIARIFPLNFDCLRQRVQSSPPPLKI